MQNSTDLQLLSYSKAQQGLPFLDILFFLGIIALFIGSAWLVIISIYEIIRAQRKLRIISDLVLFQDEAVATIKVTNLGQRRIAIEEIGLSFFMSEALVYSSIPLPAILSELESVTVSLSVDKVMEEFFARKKAIGSKMWFVFLLLGLRCNAITSDGKFGVRAYRDIPGYLWMKYKDDKRLLSGLNSSSS